jgi:hypothetical protein
MSVDMLHTGADIAQIVQALVATLALIAIYFQIRQAAKSFMQSRAELNKSIEGLQASSASQLYDHYHNVTNVFLGNPKLRPYFYGGLDDNPEDLRGDIDTMCELMAGVLEHALVLEKSLPKASREECWERWVDERLMKSRMLRRFITTNSSWYVTKLVDLAKRHDKSIEVKSAQPSIAGSKVKSG